MKSVVPKKSFGQNFLTDRNIARKIVNLLEIQPGEIILEIGPGMGALTAILLKYDATIHAVELDQEAVSYLSGKFASQLSGTLFVHHKSILDFDFSTFEPCNNKIKVIGNIPYNISTEILFKLFDDRRYIQKAVLTVQKEVGKRITSKAGSKVYGITSVATELLADAKYEFDISAGCFFPAPKVISGVITISFNKNIENEFYTHFMQMVKVLFNQRRKMISNSLKSFLQNSKLEILRPKLSEFLSLRPEQLNLEKLVELFNIIAENRND